MRNLANEEKKMRAFWVSIKSIPFTNTHIYIRIHVEGNKNVLNMREHRQNGEENRIVYDIGLQMTYKKAQFLCFMCVCVSGMRYSACVKPNAFIIRVNVHFAFRFIWRNYDLYFGMNK